MFTRFRNWLLALVVLVLAYLGYNVYAVDVLLAWTNPTTFTDGTNIPAGDLTSVRVYRKIGTGTYSLYQTIPFGASFIDTNQTVTGNYCYQVAVVRSNGIASGLSNEACKTVDTRIPQAPTTLTVN